MATVLAIHTNYGLGSTWLPDSQRSQIRNIAVEFDAPVVLDSFGFSVELWKDGVTYDGWAMPAGMGGAPALSLSGVGTAAGADSEANTIWQTTITGSLTRLRDDGFRVLEDGVYAVIFDGSRAAFATGPGPNFPVAIGSVHSLFGDLDLPGPTPGGGSDSVMAVVNTGDNLIFRQSFNNPAAYKPYFDYEGNGVINTGDNFEIRTRFNKILAWNATPTSILRRFTSILAGNTPGTTQFRITVPGNSTYMAVTAECWAPGGGGDNGGGGGGAYSKSVIAIPKNTLMEVVIGAAGDVPNNITPEDTTFRIAGGSFTCVAAAGANGSGDTGGLGGATDDCVGSVIFAGGAGADASDAGGGNKNGGGGGGRARNNAAGADAVTIAGGIVGGGQGGTHTPRVPSAGGYGGGGGGGQRSGQTVGATSKGSDGRIRLSFAEAPPS